MITECADQAFYGGEAFDLNSTASLIFLMSDEKERDSTLQRFARGWIESDEAAARIWIKSLDLSNEKKNELLKGR